MRPRRAGRSVRLSGGEQARPTAAAAVSRCAAPGQAPAGAGAQMFDSDLTNQMEEWSNMKLIGISVSRQGSSAGELCIRVGS